MAKAESLVIGKCYFLLSFYDKALKMPKIRTVIYVGKNVFEEKEEENEWYFQDAGSYLEHGSFLKIPKMEKRDVFILDKDSFSLIYDLGELISDLKEIKAGTYGKRPVDL